MFNNTSEAPMKTITLLPLAATVLFAACTGSMLMSAQTAMTTAQAASATSSAHLSKPAMKIVDLPTVVVHGDPVLAAELRAQKEARIVDLPAVVVHGDPMLATELRAARDVAEAKIEV